MSKKNSKEEYSKKPELQLPLNPLTPEEREYMKRKRKESVEAFKKLFPNGKTREDIKRHSLTSDHNLLTSEKKEYLKQKTKEADNAFKEHFSKVKAERKKGERAEQKNSGNHR